MNKLRYYNISCINCQQYSGLENIKLAYNSTVYEKLKYILILNTFLMEKFLNKK
jgi:hypothetical protein